MTFESDEKRLKKGTEILKKLNFLHKAEGSFSEDFRSHTVETLFGSVWSRPGLEIQERSIITLAGLCLLYTSPSPRDLSTSRMPSSA